MSNLGPSTIREPAVNYNNFFNPYLCHVCKVSKNLQVCPWCRLISYCCNEHLQLHREQHKEFCLSMLSLSKKIYYSHDMTVEEWTELKKANVKRVKHKLNRDLEPYEEQILLFAKSCLICCRQNNLSVVCKSCMSVSMCYEHISTPYVHSCEYLRLCTKLDIFNAIIKEQYVLLPQELLNMNIAYMSDMSTYLQHCLGRSGDLDTWSYDDFLYTNYFSRPLTLLFKIMEADMYQLSLHKVLTIHIIAGTFIDRNSLLAWEVFLHHMLPDRSLFIIMIGSNLKEEYCNVKLCQICHNENKRLYCGYFAMTYRNYTRSQLYMEPDIIIGFNVDLDDDETAIVTALTHNDKPLLLTCKSESKAQQIVTKVELTLHRKSAINEKNKFASCRPYRNVESGSVFFLNQCLIIYSKETCIEPSKEERKSKEERQLKMHSNHNQPNTSNSFEA